MSELKNVKHALFVRALIKHKGNAAKAYRKVYQGCSVASSYSCGSRLLRNANVQKDLQNALQSDRFELDSLCQSLSEMLEAKKYISDGDGGLILVPDNKTQTKAVKIAFRLHGHKV